MLTSCNTFFDTVRWSKPSPSWVARGLHWDHLWYRIMSRKCTRRGSGRRCKKDAMRQHTSSVGQVVPAKVTSRIISQESSPLAVTPNCWRPISRTSFEDTGATSPNKVISWWRTCWTRAWTSQDTQETNLSGAMSRHWGWATSGYWRRSCHKGNLPGCSRNSFFFFFFPALPSEHVTWMLPQLYCATIHNAIFARKGAQCIIMRMPSAQSVCSKVDHHEPGTVVGIPCNNAGGRAMPPKKPPTWT